MTPRNDGPVQVVFDAADAELSEKGCSIVYPSGMDRGNKVLFTGKADKPTIAFDLPAYRYVGDSISAKTTLTGAEAVTWELTRDGNSVPMAEGFTKDGGTLALAETGKYILTATLTDAAGKQYTASQSITILPVIVPNVTASAEKVQDGETVEIGLTVEGGKVISPPSLFNVAGMLSPASEVISQVTSRSVPERLMLAGWSI